MEHAGIKIPYFAFFAKDSGLRPKEAPLNMLLAMGLSSFLCIFLGCNPQWLYEMLPNYGGGYHPYDATHVINQTPPSVFLHSGRGLAKAEEDLPTRGQVRELGYRLHLPQGRSLLFKLYGHLRGTDSTRRPMPSSWAG